MSEDRTAASELAGALLTSDRLARIETKLDALAETKTETATRFEKHSARLDRVERFMWLAVGISVASGVPDAIGAVAKAAGT